MTISSKKQLQKYSIAKKLINRMEILGLGPSGPIVPKALRSYSSTPQINKT
jgi:hypothetical protein